MGKAQERYEKNKIKYAVLRRKNARNYYWKKRGKGDYYFIKRDIYLLNKKLKGIQKACIC